MVDKNLFLHDLAVVAIMKNEGPYLKEWLDYHLLAGVDHFYLYDNESPDMQAEVAKPYVAAGLVDYFPFPGKAMQVPAYIDAVKRFKFYCRYMAFIDGDEFIYPKSCGGGVIAEVVDEILSHEPNAAGLTIHWKMFDSNGQEKADYSRGVLERFTHCANGIARVVKTIANPRKICSFHSTGVHTMMYFKDFFGVDENLNVVKSFKPTPATAEKIVINHYQCKSLEEYMVKIKRGDAVFPDKEMRTISKFRESQYKKGKFDDGILKYRDTKAKVYQPPDKSHTDERLLSALEKNLAPTLQADTPQDFYAGKIETFLTCRAVASYLKTKLADDTQAKFFEEAALKAIIKSFSNPVNEADKGLFKLELSELLKLPYSVVKELRNIQF